jgi:hypothetical protein
LPGKIFEPEGFTRKIFWNKGLAGGFGALFSADFCKILDLLGSRFDDWAV